MDDRTSTVTDWSSPVRILGGFTPSTQGERVLMFLGHLDSRIYLTDRAYIDVGAGSLRAERQVTMVRTDAEGSLGSIGRFTMLGACEVMAMGEHDHDRPVNVGLGSVPIFASLLKERGQTWLKRTGPIAIGNGVVVSSGAKVLPGVSLGDGCVVGAGAIVTRDVAPFSIVAGVPAAQIKARAANSPWWDFHPAYMAELLSSNRLDEAAGQVDGHRYWLNRPRIAYRASGTDYKPLGFVDDGLVVGFEKAPPEFRNYLSHAFGDGPHVWLSNPWP